MSTSTENTDDLSAGIDDDAVLMAELDAFDAESSDDEAEENTPAPTEGGEEGAGDDDAEPGDDAKEDATEETSATPDSEAEPEPDAKLTSRLETIQQAEERSKATIDEHRVQAEQAVATREAELAPRLELAESFEKLKSQVAYDLPGVLRALGVKDEDFDAHAKILHLSRPEALSDPRTRDAAQRAMQQRKQTDVLDAMQAKLDAFEQRDQERTKQEETAKEEQVIQQRVDAYIDSVTEEVGAAAPFVAALVASNPKEARAGLARCVDELWAEYGEKPDHKDVVKRFETERRTKLKSFGIDPETALAAKNTKTKTPAAGEKTAAKTLTSNLGTPTRPRTEPQTEEEIDAEIARGLDELDSLSQ